ncbi:Aldo/keto reductase [Hesseltinella vesiculosa]|uniref:Aldo/keto reductase n=1 Tax=Hesseltinella vesiculosa TaxID=101127 RepID=A0A1X2GIH5_9FUNG|nr:Aldo/keto reductase [Hesseltinella vesiculosa]
MEYTRLGNTGLTVSKIALGCMSYGSSQWASWVKDEDESLELIKKAYDQGINFFDTADAYANGASEKVLGAAIKKFNLARSRIVVATKLFFPVMDDMNVNGFTLGPNDPRTVNARGLSRKHIFDAVDASLERLGLEYIDLLYIHRFDKTTPIEETMEALHDIVKSGKVRYIGASSMYAWQFVRMNAVAEKNGWTQFKAMQNLYNLIYREEEREMIPYLIDQGIGQVPWSPLARGLLARPAGETSQRHQVDHAVRSYFDEKSAENDAAIITRVAEVADKKNVPMSQVALAWVLKNPAVSSAIVGISKESHLMDAIATLKVKLTDEEVALLEEPYMPRHLIPM